ncbi:tyrosine-type recombinase/integrase [Bradyrhizobium sp. HKCCYLRH3099]|uniref:tyrosine-type recombinase/integrase n=1 Tax=unclassified Bradyrhizobium TaxID=2631580 RepID=UPI003EBA06AE
MRKVSRALNPAELKTLPDGEHCDGNGLYLRVTGMGGRSWIVKYQWDKKQEKIGIGSLAEVGLAAARAEATKIRAKVLDKVNPKSERVATSSASVRSSPLFKEFATEIVAAKVQGMKSDKGIAKWWRSVNDYCASIHTKQIHEITVDDITAVLAPRWLKNPQAMRNCRSHLQHILGAAIVKGHRSRNEMNPAQWDDNLKFLLSKQPRKGKVRGSHPAMDYADLPSFMAELRQKETLGAWCLETLILTGVRTTEALQMQWSQINFAKRKWVIPGKAMKNGLEASIPLTDTVVARLKEIKALSLPGDYVFPGMRPGMMMSNNTMLKLLQQDLKRPDVTVHGFRTSFRSWGQNETTHSRECLEYCLHHIEGGEAELAYKRGDMLDKRRAAMKDWETFCNTLPVQPEKAPSEPAQSHLRLVSTAA